MVRLSRVSVIHVMLGIFAALLIGQAARVQLMQGKEWADRARRQQFNNRSVAATRGNIFDAAGNILGQSREMFQISIAPTEVNDPRALAREMRALRIGNEFIRKSLDKKEKWVPIPNSYPASDITKLVALRGVHTVSIMTREYPSASGVRRIVGNLDPAGRPVGGIELALDSILRGDSSVSQVARDVKGRRLDSPDSWTSVPRPGNNVTLTINRDLQDICERALARAVDSLEASGGDIVVLNPASGEVLAMASRRVGQKSFSITAVTEPFEPGSTLKPFIAAALLDRKRARIDEVVNTHNGLLVMDKRKIRDIHKAASMNLADVIRYSSNIGIVEFGSRLSSGEKYEVLRDLGLGVSTGLPLPGESDGTLRPPHRWSGTSAASLVMGYEVTVTPLQLAAAYAALANGGELLQPHVVKEVRDPDGEVLYQSRRRVVRRVFTEKSAQEVLGLLRSVVDSGTALKADLETFQLAGKSGTARRTQNGRYVEGNYTASFVGLFPAEKPQYVVLVKLDSPRRAYYGGEIAAPVTSVVLRAALAARNAALDRSELASVEKDVPLASLATVDSLPADTVIVRPPVEFTEAFEPAPERASRAPQVVSLPWSKKPAPVDTSLRAVPDVQGLTTRNAVRALHQAGFRVTLATGRLATPTIPEAGTLLAAGKVVKLQHIP